jgi:hypothetical protein
MTTRAYFADVTRLADILREYPLAIEPRQPAIVGVYMIELHIETQLDAEKQLRAAAERNADNLRLTLRMLDAAPKTTPPAPPAKRRRWFNR